MTITKAQNKTESLSPLWAPPRFENIPKGLKSLNQWVVWRAVKRGDKWTKPPFNAANPKKPAKVNDPSTWSSFETARRAYENSNGYLTGIGFMLSKDDGFCAWDLDHCITETNMIEEWAMEILEIMDSYTETSPSGTGLRIFFKGSIPSGRRKKGNIEVYQDGRYVTVTSDRIDGSVETIEERTAQAALLHAKIFGESTASKKEPVNNIVSTGGRPPFPQDDMSLLEASFKWNGKGKFRYLFNGDFSRYPSQSEADQAFCNHLAWLLQKDPTRMEAIFRQSGLMRPKWSTKHNGKQTYGQMTIERAIAGTNSTYTPKARQNKQVEKPRKQAATKTLTDIEKIYQKVIDEFNEKHADIMLNGQRRIMNHDIDIHTGQPVLSFSHPNDFLGYYKGDTVTIPTKTEKGGTVEKKVDRAKIWINDPRRHRYNGLAFEPNKPPVISFNHSPHKRIYNMWTGFAVKPKQGDWSLFREHVEQNIAAGNPEVSEYIFSWLARIFQDPGGKRPGVTIVMKGKQGTGKSFFVERISELLPAQHYTKVSQSSHVAGRFNAHLKSTLLLFVDEGTWGGNKDAEGAIKDMITSDTRQIEGKGQNVVSVRSHLNMIIASNNDWIIPAGLEERRFFVIEVADFPTNVNKGKYFQAIADQMNNGGREAMMFDLLHRDISGTNLKEFPRTEALFNQILNTMTTVQKYWFESLRRGTLLAQHEEWEAYVGQTAQYNEFVDFAADIGDRYPGTDIQFSRTLNQMCSGIKKSRIRKEGARVRVRMFPDLSTCRRQFEELVQMNIDWETMA